MCLGSLYSFALCKEIRDFGRKDKRTAVIALHKLDHDFSRLFREVFVEEMTSGGKNLELEFACIILDTTHKSNKSVEHTLHLSNHQFLVQPVGSSEQQKLGSFSTEELAAHASEPILPVWFCARKLCPPGPAPI